ncbi:MAG: hypothetical protein ACR2M9_04735 [Cyanophyceae cyanobacterium]
MELNKQDIEDEFRHLQQQIDELTNNLKWQQEENQKFIANIEGLETEVDNLVRQLKIMNRAVEGMAQIVAIHLGVPLADLYWNH